MTKEQFWLFEFVEQRFPPFYNIIVDFVKKLATLAAKKICKKVVY